MPSRAFRSLAAPGSPWPLALLRIAVCLVILVSNEPRLAQQCAGRPHELWLAPAGVAWFLPIFAWLSPHLWLVERLLQASAVLALLGLWTRASLSLLALTFAILFGGAQLGGSVVHDMHLLWFLLLLLASPASQILSLDAWARGILLDDTPTPAAGIATRFARLLLGMVYFFPGLHKLTPLHSIPELVGVLRGLVEPAPQSSDKRARAPHEVALRARSGPGVPVLVLGSCLAAAVALQGARGETQALQAFAGELLRRERPPLAPPSVLRFYTEAYATAPEAYGRPPASRVLLIEKHL